MANGYGNNGSNDNRMGMRRASSPTTRRRSGNGPTTPRSMNTRRRFNSSTPTGASRSFVIENGKSAAGVQQWLSCPGQTVTSDCTDATDAYNIALISGTAKTFRG